MELQQVLLKLEALMVKIHLHFLILLSVVEGVLVHIIIAILQPVLVAVGVVHRVVAE